MFINGDINGRTFFFLLDFTRLDNFMSDMLDSDDSVASFFDKVTFLENMNVPLVRASKDRKTNTIGYWLIDTCKNNNLFIVNGRFGKDEGIGETTFRDKSLIDYTLCSAESFEILNDFEVIELDSVFSDGHALLEWSIKCNNPINDVAPKSVFEPKFIWSENSKNNFIDNIDQNEIRRLQAKLDNMQSQKVKHNVASGTINTITNGIGEILNRQHQHH